MRESLQLGRVRQEEPLCTEYGIMQDSQTRFKSVRRSNRHSPLNRASARHLKMLVAEGEIAQLWEEQLSVLALLEWGQRKRRIFDDRVLGLALERLQSAGM